MNHRMKVFLPQNVHDEMNYIAQKIGMPVATFIAMLVTDTLLNQNLNASKSKRRKTRKEKAINIGITDEFYYNVIAELKEKAPNYTDTDLVLDCIEYQRENFSEILNSYNPEHIKRQRIANTETSKYTKEKKQENKALTTVEEYLKKKSDFWGIKIGSVKKYYLAKEVNNIIKAYETEKRIFSTPERY